MPQKTDGSAAAVAVSGFSRAAPRVPAAIVDSQERLVEDVASTVDGARAEDPTKRPQKQVTSNKREILFMVQSDQKNGYEISMMRNQSANQVLYIVASSHHHRIHTKNIKIKDIEIL